MDTKTLIADTKARFSHNAAKAYLKDKYQSKLIAANQGGLWVANLETITSLSTFGDDEMILIDSFNNPVKVNRKELREKLELTYSTVMAEWHSEWMELEKKR
jgi:hypothetical protein